MSIMNSMIMKMIMGSKDQTAGEDSPFKKYEVDSPDNPFGTYSSDPGTNFLLQGGEKAQYSLGDYGKPFLSGGGFDQGNTTSLSALAGSPSQASTSSLVRKYSLGDYGYMPLRYMR